MILFIHILKPGKLIYIRSQDSGFLGGKQVTIKQHKGEGV